LKEIGRWFCNLKAPSATAEPNVGPTLLHDTLKMRQLERLAFQNSFRNAFLTLKKKKKK